MSFARLLAGNAVFADKIGLTLGSLPFFDIRTDGCPGPQELISQYSRHTGRFIEILAKLYHPLRKFETPLRQITLHPAFPSLFSPFKLQTSISPLYFSSIEFLLNNPPE
jgi:hypothetical protein